MPSLPSPDQLVVVVPTSEPQRLIDAAGATISLVVTEANPDVIDEISPNDVFVAQPQGTPVLKNPDGSSPNFEAAVLTPYSLVTPPGVIRVG